LIGTSTNLVVNGQYQALTGAAGFRLFDITAVGLVAAVIGILLMLIFFPRWLPDRQSKQRFADLREFTLEVAVDPAGPLVGKSVLEAGLRNLIRVYLVEIERDGTVVTAVPSEERLKGGDRLVFAGDTEAISDLLRIKGIMPSEAGVESSSLNRQHTERRLVEAVVSPHCTALGRTIRDARFRDRYGAVVLAVARNGERIVGNLGSIRLEAGDTLLLEARPAFVTRQRYNKDFLLVNDLQAESPRHERAYVAWTVLVIVIAAATSSLMSMMNAALLGAALMIVSGCCTVNQAGRGIDLQVLATIAASFSLGLALEKTGVASLIAEAVIGISSGDALLMLILTYVTVSLLTEVITNNAAALIMLPITLNMTEQAQLYPEPFVLAIMMAASASFATPIGYQTNLMVYGPGNYRFQDYLRVGLPMNLIVGIASITAIYFFWPIR
jgi:di/tricarboxylate transporter